MFLIFYEFNLYLQPNYSSLEWAFFMHNFYRAKSNQFPTFKINLCENCKIPSFMLDGNKQNVKYKCNVRSTVINIHIFHYCVLKFYYWKCETFFRFLFWLNYYSFNINSYCWTDMFFGLNFLKVFTVTKLLMSNRMRRWRNVERMKEGREIGGWEKHEEKKI